MNKFSGFLVAAAVFVLSTSAFADGSLRWTKSYGWNNDDEATSVIQTPGDKGYLAVGFTNSQGLGGYDMLGIKTDSIGDTMGVGVFGGIEDDKANEVQLAKDKGYIIVGYTTSYGAGGQDVYLIKIDSMGQMIWSKTYGGSGDEAGNSVQQTFDGGYIIVGMTNSYGSGGQDIYVIKTNSTGDTVWTRVFGDPRDDWGVSVQQTVDSGYIIAANTTLSSYYTEIVLSRLDSQGNELWAKGYPGNGDDQAFSVQQTADSGFILAGWTGSFDAYLLKTNSAGDSMWSKAYGGSGDDEAYSVRQTNDGGYIFTGLTTSYGQSAGNKYVYLVKTKANGDTSWTRFFGNDSGWNWGNSVKQTMDGGYIIAGMTQNPGNGSPDVYLIKTDSAGYVAVEDTPGIKPQLSKLEIEQNPARGFASLSYYIPAKANVSLKVYDIAGNMVKTLVNGNKNAGNYNAELGGLTEGVYFARLATGNNTVTKKIVLLK